MLFSQRFESQIKYFLLFTGLTFVVQFGIPHVSLAAQENYLALSKGENTQFNHTLLGPSIANITEEIIIDRMEKFILPVVGETQSLPLEGEPSVIKEMWITVTAYSSTPDQTNDMPFTTAWMTPVRDGVIAANFLPFGSMVRFPDVYGDKVFYVEDRMNARYTYRVDIWMYTRQEARQFGLRYLRMEILSTKVPRDYIFNNFEPAFPGMK